MSQGRDTLEPVKDETSFIEWNGYRYYLHTDSFKYGYGIDGKREKILSYTGGKEGFVGVNNVLLKTVARMRLCATNETGAGIDTVPSGVLLQVKEVRLRKNSSIVYYAKVESVDGIYKGWVSLGSSHYDLYTRSEKITTCTYKDDCGNTWITDDPLPLFDPNTKEVVMKDLKSGVNIISYSSDGIAYNF